MHDHLPLPGPGQPGARIDVEGTLNLRDLGGYPTADGGRVRGGLVFRSDHLNLVTDAGLRALTELGLATVIDLRFEREVVAQPSRLPDGTRVVRTHPDGMEAADQAGILEQILAGEITEFTTEEFALRYREMVSDGVGMIVTVLTHLAAPGHLPALFHCTAGKDRTGLSAALLLRLLGVDDDWVRRDYWLTNPYRTQARLAEMTPVLAEAGIDVEAVKALFVADVAFLQSALDHIDAHGGTEAYLIAHGLDPVVPGALRELLVEH
jgi:protein-tyrosine phosphatase